MEYTIYDIICLNLFVAIKKVQRQPAGLVNARRDCGSSTECNNMFAAFESADQHQQSPRMPPIRRKYIGLLRAIL